MIHVIMIAMRKAALFFAFCSVVLLLSCTKEETGSGKSENSADGSPEVSESTRRITEKPSDTMRMELVEPAETAGAADKGKEEKPPLPGKLLLLGKQSEIKVPSEDLIIGKLHNVSAGADEENAVYRSVEQFLQALTEGRLAEAVVVPHARQDLHRLLAYHFEQGNIPEQYRIGEIFMEDAAGRADVRLLGAPGRAAGEIYCTAEEGRWLISDLQVDLSELGKPYEIEGQYEPNVYRWIHQY